jgi:hypothetical protein
MARKLYPEPVPAATQLAVMPFLAALEGFLAPKCNVPRLRITIHRIMSRENEGFLQQLSGHFPITDSTKWREEAGSLFHVKTGIIGRAFADRRIWRTKSYPDDSSLEQDLKESMREVGEIPNLSDVGRAWLAVPFLGPAREVVLILFAECGVRNFFDDERLEHVVAMCQSLCKLFDTLQNASLPNLHNFALQPGRPVAETASVYKVQESVDTPPPAFQHISSFNYEASVA